MSWSVEHIGGVRGGHSLPSLTAPLQTDAAHEPCLTPKPCAFGVHRRRRRSGSTRRGSVSQSYGAKTSYELRRSRTMWSAPKKYLF